MTAYIASVILNGMEAAALRGTPRLLIVEDDVMIRRSLARCLHGRYDTRSVGCANDALTLLRRERFDLVLCDVHMPETSGKELFGMVESEMPEQASRFVFLSGVVDHWDREEPFLSKPVSKQELESTLEGVLAKHALP